LAFYGSGSLQPCQDLEGCRQAPARTSQFPAPGSPLFWGKVQTGSHSPSGMPVCHVKACRKYSRSQELDWDGWINLVQAVSTSRLPAAAHSHSPRLTAPCRGRVSSAPVPPADSQNRMLGPYSCRAALEQSVVCCRSGLHRALLAYGRTLRAGWAAMAARDQA
jgi:hypothetical protein